jgi:hypothetical protein
MATVNGEDITALDLGYWLSYDINMVTYYYGSDVDWTTYYDEDAGETYADWAKEDALNIAVSYALLRQQAEEVGVELSEDDVAAIDETMASYATSFGENLWDEAVSDGTVVEDDYTDEEKEAWIAEQGQVEFENQLALYCADEDQLRNLNEVTTLYNSLDDYYYGDNGVALPTDEELAAYVEDEGYLASRSILFSTITDEDGNDVAFADMTDEQKATLKAEAQAALDEILASDDPTAAFLDKMVNDNDDPGLTEETDCYVYPAGTMVTEYEDAVSALEENAIGTELVESEDYGYFLVMRLPLDYDTTVNGSSYSIRELYCANGFTDMLDKWNEEAEITTTEAFENLDVSTVYANLTALNEALYPTETEEDATEATETVEETETAE